MTSVRGQGRPVYRGQASEAPTSPPISNGDHKDPLGSNKPGLSKASAGSEAPEASSGPPESPPGPPQAPPFPVLQDPETNYYSQQDLDRIIQPFL